jgi:CheY-like chemotaxis protein
LDIMVPGGDGLDVCRRLRSHPAAEHDTDHLSYRPGG